MAMVAKTLGSFLLALSIAMGGDQALAGPLAVSPVGMAPVRIDQTPIILAQNEGWHPLKPLFRLFRGGQRTQKRHLQEVAPPKRTLRRRAAPVVPRVVALPKDPDARTVLVVGDAMADGVHTGLLEAFAETPGLAVEKSIRRSRGLTRAQDVDWPARITEAIEGGSVDLVVVMLGADDIRSISGDAGRLAFRSPEWESAYRAAVQAVVSSVRGAGKPLIWVGLPPVSGPDRRADFNYLNDFYKQLVEPADGIFVDIWEAFLSEAGKYTSYGADVDGKRRRLRTEDGLYFTGSGYRKVAFFVERPIARILGEGRTLDLTLPQNDPDYLLLTGLSSDEDTLAGAEIAPAIPIEGSLQHQLIVEGRALPMVTGRADDFRRPAE